MTVSDPISTPTAIHHVRLTITDIARSKHFYSTLLGKEPAADFSDQAEDSEARNDPDRLFAGCIFAIGDQVFGLRPGAPESDSFSPTRVGLDHVSLQVGSLDELNEADARLTAANIEHGEIKKLDDFGLAILSVQDPDDINLELAAPYQS